MTDEERAIDVAAATPRVNAILHPNGAAITNVAPYEAPQTAPKPPRAPRSDKGTHRPPGPPKPHPAGKLSREQVDELEVRRGTMQEAETAYLAAHKAYFDYLEEITAKG
jgi:hypothetical protein